MDKDRSKFNPNTNERSACAKCTKPDTCIHLRTIRQQQLEKISSTRVLHMVRNFQENRSDEDIFFDCMSIGDSDLVRDANSCKSSSGKSSSGKGPCHDPEALRAALERVAQGTQMMLKNFDQSKCGCRKSCNATLEITARLITDSKDAGPNCRFQGRPVTMKMPLEFDPSTGQLGAKSAASTSSRPICSEPSNQYSQPGCPALIYMQDERPSPRQVPKAIGETDDSDNIPIRSQKMQTDQSYLKDKWRPNRTDFEQESNNVSVKSSQTDNQSKKEAETIPNKPSQTDTSFLYDQYMRSRGENKTQDAPSQTNLKQDLNEMGNIRYPTNFVPGMGVQVHEASKNNSSRNISRRPSDPTIPSTVAPSQKDKCTCDVPFLNVCPSKSMPTICAPNKAASSAFQSTCSKQSTQPSQDSTAWYSLESDTSNASKPTFCPKKSCKSLHMESMLTKCSCKSLRPCDNFRSAQSSRSGYPPLDLSNDMESQMQSAQSKSIKCFCQNNVKPTQSSKSLPCGERNRSAPCVTVVYCPLRDYVHGPTSIDIEMGQICPDISNDATNWQSARSNLSNACDPTISNDTCFRTVESNPTAVTPWNSAKSTNSCFCDSSKPNPLSKPSTNTCFLNAESNPQAVTAWSSVKSSRSCGCNTSNQIPIETSTNTRFLNMESNPQAVTAWNSVKSDKSCACNSSNQIPIRTSKSQICSRAIVTSDQNFGSNHEGHSNCVDECEIRQALFVWLKRSCQ
ncbi:uncharacterized protein LOC117790003 isoform X5 [Drosophila innubila]|uniref:uncharacterized protein LOC117790003 isoform X5 n=1 Tax=Drosophila innubila TaxID=198719 RepID=UPI00148B7EF7|nr:uncharacterized protein LOC117790003 isoform X5 [Drosophila innubila]